MSHASSIVTETGKGKIPRYPWTVKLIFTKIIMFIFSWRANRANTMRQKTVRVMTSASCFTEWSNALMIVFKPEINTLNNKNKITFIILILNDLFTENCWYWKVFFTRRIKGGGAKISQCQNKTGFVNF